MSAPWPVALEFRKSDQVLAITFDDGADYAIPYKLLREESPSIRGVCCESLVKKPPDFSNQTAQVFNNLRA